MLKIHNLLLSILPYCYPKVYFTYHRKSIKKGGAVPLKKNDSLKKLILDY